MKKSSVKACLWLIFGFAFLALVAFGVLVFIIQRNVSLYEKYYAVVEDSIFDEYFKNDVPESADFTVISHSGFCSLDFGMAVAFVSKKDGVGFADFAGDSELTKNYLLKSKNYYPSLPVDFDGEKNLYSPDLSISISDSKNLPDGNRALPVNQKHAGDEGYALEKKDYASCSVLNPKFADSVFRFFSEFFNGKTDAENKTLFLSVVGDIMVERGVQEILLNEEGGLEKVFGKTLNLLQGSDFAIGNLEGAVTEATKRWPKTFTFKFHKEVLEPLKKAGFDYLMLTNNHCYDYGEQGFKDTLAAFEEYKVPTSGVGYNADEARKFYHTTVNGTKLAIISCGAFPTERTGFNGATMASATETRAGILWRDEAMLEDIKKEKAEGNFVIVNVHGGVEYMKTPTESQRSLYESFIDAGADAVFGSHPHVVQPTEYYKNGVIVYSLGNFIFNEMGYMAGFGAQDTEVVRLGLDDGRIVYTEIYPAKINGPTVDLK